MYTLNIIEHIETDVFWKPKAPLCRYAAMPLCSARKATVPWLKMARASCQCSEPQLGSISQPSQTGDFVAVQLELQQKLLQNWSKNRMSSHVIACHRMSSWVGQVGLLLETLRDLRPRCVQAAHASASSLVDESRVGVSRFRGQFYSKPPTSEHHLKSDWSNLNALQLIQQSYPFRSFQIQIFPSRCRQRYMS